MKKVMSGVIAFLIAAITLPFGMTSASASEVDSLIGKLVEKGVLTRLDAETIQTEIEIDEKVRYAELRDEFNPWLEGLTSKGDIRLRLEGFEYDSDNRKDRVRQRVRLRWGLEKEFNDEWKAGFRLSSGPTDEATSTNQTLDDEFDFKNFNLNRVYGIWTPTARVQEWFPATEFKNVEIGFGKVANPYKDWGTSLVWDGDVEPEGLYEAVDMKLSDIGSGGSWDLHFLLGQWILEEQSSRKDVQMQSYGVGTTVQPNKEHKYVAKYVFYDWQDYDSVLRGGIANSETDNIDSSNLTGVSPGNNDLQTDSFKIHSIYLEGSWKNVALPLAGSQYVKVFGQYVKNAEEGGAVTFADEDDAWTAGVQVGKAKKKGTQQFKYQYYHIEPNATVGNFSESDLGSGGTNNKGHKFQYKYQILDNVQLAWTNWLAEDLNSTSAFDTEVWRTQLDTIFKF